MATILTCYVFYFSKCIDKTKPESVASAKGKELMKYITVVYMLAVGYINEHNAVIDCACQDMQPRLNCLQRINVFCQVMCTLGRTSQ